MMGGKHETHKESTYPGKKLVQNLHESCNDKLDKLMRDLPPRWAASAGSSSDQPTLIEVYAVQDLTPENLTACLDLVEETSADDYRKSRAGWSRRHKRMEMQLPDLRYILVKTAPGQPPSGFISFMLTFEDGIEVIYIYEIHLQPELRGQGIGKQLIGMVELASQVAEVEKTMLTVYKTNEKAVRFYTKLGYGEDDSSPGPRVLRNGVIKEPDYIILSKPTQHG